MLKLTGRLASSLVNVIKNEVHPPRVLAGAAESTSLQQGSSSSSAAAAFGSQRAGIKFFLGHKARENAEMKACLKKYVNLDFAQKIYEKNKDRIQPRDESNPPTEAGILAVIAYTSGGLDKHLARFEAQGNSIRDEKFKQDMTLLKKTIGDTIKLLKNTDVDVVRRNTQLHKGLLDAFAPGKQIQFDRITSVTLNSKQAYTGGNVDFVIRPKEGVVSVENLSEYTSNKGGEAEAILEPGAKYEVVSVDEGKENGTRSEDPDFPVRTITLSEVEKK